MPVQYQHRIGIDVDVDRLAGPDPGKLGLLEIRGDPDVARHQHHQSLADLGIIALGGSQIGNRPRDRGLDLGASKVRLGLLQACLRLFELAGTDLTLCLQNLNLPLGDDQICLIRIVGGLVLLKLGRGLLRALLSPGTALEEPLRASVFLARKAERRLRLQYLLLGLDYSRLLGIHLRVEVGDAGLRLRHLRNGLIDSRPVIPVIDARQNVARIDRLIVPYREINDRATNLGTDRHSSGVDEGVVGRLIPACIEPPYGGQGDCPKDNEAGYRGKVRVPSSTGRETADTADVLLIGSGPGYFSLLALRFQSVERTRCLIFQSVHP